MNLVNTKIINNNFVNNIPKSFTPQSSTSFKDALENAYKSNLQFSKHASVRLGNRDINISNDQMKRVENGIEKAKEKGIHDSLIIVDNISLLINIKSKVVITAMENNNERVYTNIDGAVIV